MAELNKASSGVRLNGEGNPKRDPVISEIESRIIKDNGSTVTARFDGQREGYVSSHKMNGTRQVVTNSRVNYWADKNATRINIRAIFGKILKMVVIILVAYLLIMLVIGYTIWGNITDALYFLEDQVINIPIIGTLYEYIKTFIAQEGGY